MMEKLIIILVPIFLAVANAIPIESSRNDADIPPLIKNIYDRMSEDVSLKYLRIVQNLRWLAPVKLGPGENISDSYSYKLTFNTSGLQKQPTSIWLHLNTVPSDHLAVINITIGQEVFVWRQPTMDDDENQTEVQINLGSLLTWTASTLTVKVTSTIHIKTDHFGLLLYMGETPEAVNDLLIKPPGKTKIINDQDKRLKKDIENINYEVPCQRKSLIVPLNQLGGSFENIVAPVTADIGQCVGECPVTNQTLRTELLDLLAPGDLDLEEGSAHENTLLKVGCAATSLLPLTVLRIDQNGLPIVEPLKNLIIDSCGCFQCSP